MAWAANSEPRGLGLEGTAAAEAERLVAWLRVAAIALLVAGERISQPNPVDETYLVNTRNVGFFVAIAAFTGWSLALLALVHLRPVSTRLALVATVVDIGAITSLALLSGGGFSLARLAYFVVPVAVAFRFRPSVTAAAAALTVGAYLAQSFAQSSSRRPQAAEFIAVHAGYLAWIGLAAVLLATVLARRTRKIEELAAARRRLLADALEAEERERQTLADGLHDSAIQNLLSARHELEEAAEQGRHPALERAETAIMETVAELREAVFELHPYVLEQAGLPDALRAVGSRAARLGGFRVQFDLRARGRSRHELLLLSAARELLANAARHARARNVTVRLVEEEDELVLAVADDGAGFDPAVLPERVAAGHVGIASQRVRIESVGGRLEIRRSDASGTLVEVRLPR